MVLNSLLLSSSFSDQALFNTVRSSIDDQADRNETEIELTSGAALGSSLSEFGVIGVIKHRHKPLMQLHDLASGQIFWVRTVKQSMGRCIVPSSQRCKVSKLGLFSCHPRVHIHMYLSIYDAFSN